ncbi:hypothetical protein Dcar01_00658 [Deinococcus carri]|uniref:HTH marR-type domain-containing protein n=1 Tax=Deinococcus carri TaxID=1211323 RepID=A0ABP9W3L2_9DEIO
MQAPDTAQAQVLAGRINQLIIDLWVATERDAPRYDYDQFALTGQQHVVLGQIVRNPRITPKELADSLGVSKGAISQHLTRLEQEDYFIREKSPHDKRVSLFQLRPRGLEYQRVLRQYEQYLADAYLKQLSLADLQEIVGSLEKLGSVFQIPANS